MTTKTITPGPWRAECVGSTGGDNPVDVYEITNGFTRIAENVSERDAKLIAAAPRLLECLRNLLSFYAKQESGFYHLMAEDAVREAAQ